LLFAGDQDLICNYVGQESLIQSLTWNGGTGLGEVETQTWTVGDTPAGTWVASRNLTYVKIFNASHMAGYDQLHATHDMILRFMGMNFSAIADGTARIPSSVGGDAKPVFTEDKPALAIPTPTTKTPEQDKAMWEAYYNAGSSAIVLILILAALGTILWCRIRRRRLRGLPIARNEEEHIPLTQSMPVEESESSLEHNGASLRKGKERAKEIDSAPIFDVGDSDEDH